MSVTQTCPYQSCSYRWKWNSQPLLGSSPAGNLNLSAAVYYTGSSFVQTNKVCKTTYCTDILFLGPAPHSGTGRCSACWNVTEVASDCSFQVLNAMHVRTFSKMTHKNYVSKYILPSVLHKRRVHQSNLLEEMKRRGSFSLGGDMRADSPGHCAKYGSYSMMDLENNKIGDVQLVQVKGTKSEDLVFSPMFIFMCVTVNYPQSNEVGSSVRM